jgi:UDP-N-acetylglucosamine 2-epimerase (non-hydrolysing)
LGPDVVLALGDTNTVPAYALAARSAGVPFAHLEAGLRSFNQRSVEEVNRRVAAATASLHFAPTARAAAFLHAEGVPDQRVFVVGNPAIDTLLAAGVPRVAPSERTHVLVTAHRASNVDDPARLARLVRLLSALASTVGPVRFAVHPRTAARLAESGLRPALDATAGVTCTPPLPYTDLLTELASSKVVVTDSGGIQEEAAFFGVPVVVLRRSTPRWEGVEAGSAALAGLTSDGEAGRALACAAAMSAPDRLAEVSAMACPYGDGTTAAQVAAILADPATSDLLRLDEPDFSGGNRPW